MFKHLIERIQGRFPAGHKRSNAWPAVRAKHLEQHPVCEVCLGSKKLEVHHMVPFHINPRLELNPANLITLCESKKWGINCHLYAGHLGNFKQYNTNVIVFTQYLTKAWRFKK